jgi:septum site-determining protein MinD
VGRFLGEELPHRFLEPERRAGLFKRLFGGRAA